MAKAVAEGIPKLRIEECAARRQARIDSGSVPVQIVPLKPLILTSSALNLPKNYIHSRMSLSHLYIVLRVDNYQFGDYRNKLALK